MKTEEFNDKGQTLAPYASPRATVIEVSVQGVVCQSIPNSPEEYGNDIW